MRAIVQRVSQASVNIDGSLYSQIDHGLLVYLGVDRDDKDEDVKYIVDKVSHLRIFPDDTDRMNLNVVDVKGKVLVVSAFSIQADARKGRRPGFEQAAAGEQAEALYEKCCDALIATGLDVERGSFGAMMDVRSNNDGPVCILLDSHRKF